MGDGEREMRSTFSLRAPLQERRKPRVPALERDLVGAALRQAQGRLQPRALAPSPAKAGGVAARLRTIGSRANERTPAVLAGRTGWGGVSSRSARTGGTPSKPSPAVAGGGADATPRASSARPAACPRARPLRPRAGRGWRRRG